MQAFVTRNRGLDDQASRRLEVLQRRRPQIRHDDVAGETPIGACRSAVGHVGSPPHFGAHAVVSNSVARSVIASRMNERRVMQASCV